MVPLIDAESCFRRDNYSYSERSRDHLEGMVQFKGYRDGFERLERQLPFPRTRLWNWIKLFNNKMYELSYDEGVEARGKYLVR